MQRRYVIPHELLLELRSDGDMLSPTYEMDIHTLVCVRIEEFID